MAHYLWSMWNDLFVPGVPLFEKTIRTLIVYIAVILGLKLAGKREPSQLNPFDLVVLLLLSNTVQNAIIGNDSSIITLAELEAAARRQGISSIAEIEECRLETGGALTFVAKTPTPEDTQHREVIERLEAIERKLEMLTAR